jgi:hypothetical protein
MRQQPQRLGGELTDDRVRIVARRAEHSHPAAIRETVRGSILDDVQGFLFSSSASSSSPRLTGRASVEVS